MKILDFMWTNRLEVLNLTLEHLVMVSISILIAAAIGLPLGILMTRKPGMSRPVLTFANIVQTIPSLALFGFLIPIPILGGIGTRTAVVALVLYSLLPIIRNTFIGISGVDPAIREAGRGMGMTDGQLLWKVEIPLALGVIFAGIRVATVIGVGVATIAAAVGAGGLGMFIFRGVSMVDSRLILAGAIPAAVLALLADFGLGAIEKRFSKLFCILLLVVATSSCSSGDRIVVGSKNFTEQIILGEMLAQQIERSANIPVDRRLNLGGTLVAHEALIAGQIDMYVEYTGTGLTAILKEPPSNDPDRVYAAVKAAYQSRFGIEWTEPLGFNNTFAIIIRKSDAEKLNIRTISDAAPHTAMWTAGFGYEFIERQDGYPGLTKTYNLRFPAPPRVMDLGLTYKAVAARQVDFIAGNSTDGLINALDLVVLEDDKHYFPPYDAVPLVRQGTIDKHPQIREALRALGGKISEDEMRRMNYAVDGEHRDVKQVVREFLDSLRSGDGNHSHKKAQEALWILCLFVATIPVLLVADIVIIGGGIIGSSVAFNLLQDGFKGRVVVVERDPSYQFASSALALGGVRQQFMSSVNVRMVQYSIGIFEQYPQCQFRQRGYLFLANDSNWKKLQTRYEIQKELGADCDLLSVSDVRRLVPELRCDDLVGGLLGPKDGYVDPRATLRLFRQKAEEAGTVYISDEVQKIEKGAVHIARFGLLAAGSVVIASGAYSAAVAALAGVQLPITPVRQQLFRCALPRPWTYEFPVVIDPRGVHWRSYSNNEIIIAKTKPDEPPGVRFGCDIERFYEDFLPDLVRRLPEFSDLKIVFGWGGLYEMTPDHNGIIDRHPEIDNLYFATGFSGHGLMMAPATGKLMAELIRTGHFETLDATPLSFSRFERNELFWDEAMI